MQLGSEPKKITITASIDDKTTQEERLVLRDNAAEETVSPKGDKIVFNVRNELWMVPTKKAKGPNADDAIQLTDWEGVDEQPMFVNDNTIFFVSDRNGAKRLFKMNVETKAITPVTTDDADIGALSLTPDRKSVAFWKAGKEGGLYTVSVD